MSLGSRIKECRQNSKMSQEKVAELVGVSRQAVTKWEVDQAAPSTENLFRLANVLGTTVDMLVASDEGSSQSTAEQVYYLYKMEEVKKVEEIKARRKNNIRIALIVAAGYLSIFIIGRIISGGAGQTSIINWFFGTEPGQSSYLFGWLLNSNMYLISSIISIVPALFGKYKFSFSTFIAFLLGLILGELLGSNPVGASYGIGHYGWFIWGGIFLMSMVIGVILEKITKPGVKLKSKKIWIGSITAIVVASLILVFIFSAIPKYPQPEYPVNSYEELTNAFLNEKQYILPPVEHLPDTQGVYLVDLKSRFSHEKIGYRVSFESIENEYNTFTISCRLISELSESQPAVQGNKEYNGVELSIAENHICFELNSCRYDIHFTGASTAVASRAMSITLSIINSVTDPT